jgi:hypothetical protein
MTEGLTSVGTCTPCGTRWASSWLRRFVKIAPKTETPIEPPIWRASDEPDVATPSSR